MDFKSYLDVKTSVGVSVATAVGVFSIYQLTVGNVSAAHATDANHPVLETSRKKAAYMAGAFVAGLAILTRDATVFTVGAMSIIALELNYRHGIMAHPETGQLQNPSPGASFSPAENVIPLYNQGATG